MADTIVVVAPSGGDYITPTLAEAAAPATIASGDRYIMSCETFVGGVTDSLTVNGTTFTDITSRMVLRAASGHGHAGVEFDGFYIASGNNPGISVTGVGTNFDVEDIGVLADDDVAWNGGASGCDITINRCFFRNDFTSSFATFTLNGAGTSPHEVNNCVMAGGSGIFVRGDTLANSQHHEMNFCTFYGGGGNAVIHLTLTNCWSAQATSCFVQLNASSDYLISNDATGVDFGANGLINKTSYASYFTDITTDAEDLMLLGTTDDGGVFGATGLAGTPVAGVTTDIRGVTRDVSTPDIGAYEFAVATQPPVTTNAAVDPASQSQGNDVDLSADIADDDHTIDEAEYYIDSDPGEGSGTAMSLGAGTTSREATATIDTSGLSVASHTVHVRGHDATDGWGATDSAALEITEAVAVAARRALNLDLGLM